MAEIIQTLRVGTDRQMTYTEQLKRLCIYGNTYSNGTYRNLTAGLETVKIGQLLGKIQTGTHAGKYTICKSGATDGSAVPCAVAVEEITDATAGQEVLISVLDGGEINKAALVYDGTDTGATLVPATTGIRLEDLLLRNSRSITYGLITDCSEFGNY